MEFFRSRGVLRLFVSCPTLLECCPVTIHPDVTPCCVTKTVSNRCSREENLNSEGRGVFCVTSTGCACTCTTSWRLNQYLCIALSCAHSLPLARAQPGQHVHPPVCAQIRLLQCLVDGCSYVRICSGVILL